ncbi:MAG: serine/threonine protein kinase [Geitlerinemataceae cyanobacterium]
MTPSLDRQYDTIERGLLPELVVERVTPNDPVVVKHLPEPWEIVGTGNYAAVFAHPEFSDRVVKVYAPGCPGIEEEIEVYQRLGEHPAYSRCYGSGENFLILRRIYGVTFYDCLPRGIKIPPIAIEDIDRALAYARDRGLTPHDVHGRNVMLCDGRGVMVDVSDFLVDEDRDKAWQDLRWAYRWIYRPFLAWRPVRVSYSLLDLIRKVHLWMRRS